MLEKLCLGCHKMYTTKDKNRKFCSRLCFNTYSNKLTWRDPEVRKKRIDGISKALTGKPSPNKGKTMLEICGEKRYLEVKDHFKKSQLTRQRISESKRRFWLTKTPEERKAILTRNGTVKRPRLWGEKNPNWGNHKLRGRNNPHFGKPNEYYEGHGRGRRQDLNNLFFRSRWEANFARILNYWKIPWEYEPVRFDLGDCTYLPDFKVHDPEAGDYFVEIKGMFEELDKKKFKLFSEKYPEVRLQIIEGNQYRDLQKEFSNKIENWEK